MKFRGEVEGFTGHFDTLDQLKVWATDLNRRFGLTGKVLKVHKAVSVCADGSGAAYSLKPSHFREVVIGA